ncbi:MAG: VWA domain-containing protein [Myxococcales bacterium]|nr:VWA domain-containing protein [Myxococcales bacterium]
MNAQRNVRVVGAVSTLALVAAVGCGSSDESQFGDGSGGSSGDTAHSGNGNPFGSSSGASGGSSSGTPGSVTPGSACASASAGAVAPPISLVFMVDKSGSMGGAQMSLRWTPAVAALNDFFADPASTGVNASLAFFPQTKNECSSASYSTPAVAMTALPSGAFAPALAANSPGSGTPTLVAETGAIEYAQSVAATLPPGEKVAIVLVTDGDPNDCSSTPANVAAAAATVAADIKTYVIGVGPDAANLDQIATGGGTAPHIQVNTTSAATTSADLRAAIGKIKAAQLGCEYGLPAPPGGQTLDVNAVNVDYTPAGGALQTLPYSADCSNKGGWHYDNVATPTQIVMCPDICATLQGDVTGGKIDIVFGCVTTVPPGGGLPK